MASIVAKTAGASRRSFLQARAPATYRIASQLTLRRSFHITSLRTADSDPSRSKPTPSSPKPSDSSDENAVKGARANEAAGKTGGKGGNSASVAKPVTPGQGGTAGADEEGEVPVQDQDPNKSQEEKARHTEEVGQRKLDPAD